MAGGCGSSTPWKSNPPPTASPTSATPYAGLEHVPNRATLVIGRFANPGAASVPWNDIGKGMTDALSRAMLNDRTFEVRLNPELAAKLEPAVAGAKGSQTAELEKFARTHPDIDYVVLGRVTDFVHTNDLSRDVARRGLFGRKTEAFVAIKFHIVDLNAKRVIAVDHIYGSAGADGSDAETVYKGLTIDSYLFWSTPLGKASKEAIEKARARLAQQAPSRVGEIVIARLIDARRIEIAAGRNWGLSVGQEYYVSTRSADDGSMAPVVDRHTSQPLKAVVREVDESVARAWLLGQQDGAIDLRGAVLTRELPVAAAAPPTGRLRAAAAE
jgi:curli biogenesis system outer membrane secretion channel CsgG